MALTPREMRFLAVYLAQENRNGAQAYREAISSKCNDKTATVEASKILAKPNVGLMVARFDERLTERMVMSAEDLTRMWSQVITLDRNELSELRRVCCRFCHSPNGDPQETRGEQRARRKVHDKNVKLAMARLEVSGDTRKAMQSILEEFDEQGGDGYDQRKPINPDCPECFGEGEERIILKDTTKLSPAARAVYEGVKQTRNGLEIMTYSRADAAAALVRRWGIGGGEPPKPPNPGDGATNITPRDPVEASRAYARIMNGED